jgi:GNAT superfamily N-acetyltransferase
VTVLLALTLASAAAPRASAAVVAAEAGAASAIRSAPVLLPSFAAPALSAASLPAAAPAPLALPASAPQAVAAAFPIVERRGVNGFGQPIVLLDALDARDPSAGTAAHADFTLNGAHASLDEPLDLSSTVKLPHPPDAPADADLSHLSRPHLWFGLAVKPEFQGLGLGALILEAAVQRMRASGAKTLFIRATESSRGFYLRAFGASVKSVESETDRDGYTYYRLEVDLTARERL